VFVAVPLSAVLVYHSWLGDRTLFFDEWMYLEELADAPSRIRWVLSPMQEHFTPIAKSIFVLNNLLFGYAGQAYTTVSLLLQVCFILTTCWFLHVARLRQGTVCLVALVLATTGAYAEVVIWCHDKLPLFLIGLFGALGCFLRADREYLRSSTHPPIWQLAGVSICLLLSMASLGLGVFTLLLFAVFVLTYRPSAVLRRGMVLALALPTLTYAALYVVFAWQGVWSDFHARVGNGLGAAGILSAAHTSLFSVVYGAILPLVHVHRRPSEATYLDGWVSTLLAMALLGAILVSWRMARRADRMSHPNEATGSIRTALVVLGVALTLVTSLSQNFYRARGTYPGLQFVMEWNRYAFLPIIGLIVWLAASFESATDFASDRVRRWSLVVLSTGVLAMLPSSVAEANGYQAYFFRNARVREIQTAFEPVFQPDVVRQVSGMLLPEIVIDEPLFVRPLRLSTYARFHKQPTLSSVRFLSARELEAISAEEQEAIRTRILRQPSLASLYTNGAVAGRALAVFR